MNIVKQTLFISLKNKELHLEVLLSNLQTTILKNNDCLYFEVYKSDESKEEFLVYEEWTNKESIELSYETKEIDYFTMKLKDILLKKEILPSL